MAVKLEQYLLLLAANWFFMGIDSSAIYPTLKVIESTELKEHYKLDSDTEKFRVLNVTENSDLLVDSDSGFSEKSKLILECRAPYPIQWIYKGDGNPEFATNTSMKQMEFVATVSMGFRQSLGEHDTGNYTCKSIRNPNISIYLYLFVPGNALFTTKGGENIVYNEYDENARIPCSLSQPKASVTLQKSINGTLHCPMNDSISYDPKTGYTLRIGELTDTEGMYVCTAGLNHHFQIIEYTLVSSGIGEKLKPQMNSTNSSEENESEFNSPCSSNPYGANAVCRMVNGTPACKCKSGFRGNPFVGCSNGENATNSSVNDEGKECSMNIDCAADKACVQNKCMDPCPLICAKNSTCKVTNHIPQCTCLIGEKYHEDCISETASTTTTTTTTKTTTVSETVPEQTTTAKPSGPCEPNPCGEYTSCNYDGQRILCVCLKGYLGTPPNCRPECVNDHDCPYTRACTALNKCENPCQVTVCGEGALCRTINHYPVCSCPSGRGDPYIECHSESSAEKPSGIITSPCNPSPCADNAECQVINNQAACRCVDGFRGNALKACTVDGCNYHKHCPENLACFVENGTCVDPCHFKNPCNGKLCTVKNHIPTCRLDPESSNEGNATEAANPCFSSPCGPNTVCRSIRGASSCTCKKNYVGNPYIGCSKQRCTSNDACKVGEKCIDEICQKESQSSEVTAPENITGNETAVDVCNPSPCKKGAECRIINKMAICKCVQPLEGDAYNTGCEDPCSTNADCSTQLACSSKTGTCTNPCESDNACGVQANCTVINHKITCACPENYWGNPVKECFPSSSLDQDEEEVPSEILDPCAKHSCGTNEKCVVRSPSSNNSMPICECLYNYRRQPGKGCVAVNDTQDFDETSLISTPHYVPCHPLPCGRFSYCNEKTDPKSCSCLENFYGDPYSREGCRRGIECDANRNCSSETACLNRRCLSPCSAIGVCGVNQICQTKNHSPVCRCKDGYSKTTSGYCQKRYPEDSIEPALPESIVSSENFNNTNAKDVENTSTMASANGTNNPCDPSPCGQYSECSLNEDNSTAICSCQFNMINTPPNCRPECLSNETCSLYETCVEYKCIDPCIGACGDNANCFVIRRVPSCSCKFGFTGDPIKGCLKSKGNWFIESKYVFPFTKKRLVDSDFAL